MIELAQVGDGLRPRFDPMIRGACRKEQDKAGAVHAQCNRFDKAVPANVYQNAGSDNGANGRKEMSESVHGLANFLDH